MTLIKRFQFFGEISHFAYFLRHFKHNYTNIKPLTADSNIWVVSEPFPVTCFFPSFLFVVLLVLFCFVYLVHFY